MKGTSFQKPLEFNLRIEGESWSQGDEIVGTLIVKNHGGESIPLGEIHADLAHGELKKVRQKSPDAFESLVSIGANSSAPLEAGKEFTLPWKFQTERNCPITDKLGSLFVLYGRGSASDRLGQLQLPIHPHQVIREVLGILEISFRFVVKTKKWKKNWVEVKLAPSSSQAFATLEHLILSFHFEGENLQLEYDFQIKKVEATAANLDVKKSKKTFEQSFTPLDYRLASGRFNHPAMESAVREIVSQVESKILF